jgi:hypothetical protein
MSEGKTEQPLIGDASTLQEPRPLTLGERRVRLSFNPNGNPQVDRIKRIAADAIDQCELLKAGVRDWPPDQRGEALRLYALAQTTFEEAAMWAVKAATA